MIAERYDNGRVHGITFKIIRNIALVPGKRTNVRLNANDAARKGETDFARVRGSTCECGLKSML